MVVSPAGHGQVRRVIFGWITTSLAISGNIPPNFLSQPAGQNNFGGYSNKDVDAWMNTLNVTADVHHSRTLSFRSSSASW